MTGCGAEQVSSAVTHLTYNTQTYTVWISAKVQDVLTGNVYWLPSPTHVNTRTVPLHTQRPLPLPLSNHTFCIISTVDKKAVNEWVN